MGMKEGRPTKYQDTYPGQAYKLAMLGLTDLQIAEFFGVSHQTYYDWQDAHPEFLESTHRGKLVADAETAVSLYKRANGYSHEAVKIFMPAGASAPVYAKYVEHYPPDTPAASLWLRNRQKALWRDRQEIDVNHNGLVATTGDEALLVVALAGGGVVTPSTGDKT